MLAGCLQPGAHAPPAAGRAAKFPALRWRWGHAEEETDTPGCRFLPYLHHTVYVHHACAEGHKRQEKRIEVQEVLEESDELPSEEGLEAELLKEHQTPGAVLTSVKGSCHCLQGKHENLGLGPAAALALLALLFLLAEQQELPPGRASLPCSARGRAEPGRGAVQAPSRAVLQRRLETAVPRAAAGDDRCAAPAPLCAVIPAGRCGRCRQRRGAASGKSGKRGKSAHSREQKKRSPSGPQRAGFEPARGDPIGFQVQRLNHSAIAAAAPHAPGLRPYRAFRPPQAPPRDRAANGRRRPGPAPAAMAAAQRRGSDPRARLAGSPPEAPGRVRSCGSNLRTRARQGGGSQQLLQETAALRTRDERCDSSETE
ncbi:uncharacterized protein LOC119702537 [Motacilla alba alba]|uniref:uncharacterized protein LOC119702537 n=1 Tax=Motacilla alba alba TaxID=1094192 RepID=UPI0018D57001|nr:uncharacterized protein LOC119702537 [Motacilla alba alba]